MEPAPLVVGVLFDVAEEDFDVRLLRMILFSANQTVCEGGRFPEKSFVPRCREPWNITVLVYRLSSGILIGMPVFEFRCHECKKRFSLLVGMTAEAHAEKCPHCGSPRFDKLVSRFARLKSEDERMDEISDNLERIGEPDSPSEMRKWVREMGKAMDEDAADEMEEMFEADMESGEESESGTASME